MTNSLATRLFPETTLPGFSADSVGLGRVFRDFTPPVISNITPSPGTPLNRSDVVQLDVTDVSGFGRVEIYVTLGSDTFVVHDGDKFRGRFSNLGVRAAITNGFRYNVKPNGGWTDAPTFEVHAVDTDGNEAI